MSAPSAFTSMFPKPSPAMVIDTFRFVVTSTNDWISIRAQERTSRDEIQAWEKSQFEIIQVQRDFKVGALSNFDQLRFSSSD